MDREVAERLVVLGGNLERIAGFNRIGTPVGDLPFGLGQLVLLFPVVLALGFVIVANGYAQMAAVQRVFVRLCRKRDARGEVIDAQHLAAIAPLWLDPRSPLGGRLALWAVILAPDALLAVNLGMIARTAALTERLPDDAAIGPRVFVALYAASVVPTLGAVWQIRTSARQPRDDAPPDAAP